MTGYESDYAQLRQRWEDGTMSEGEFNGVLDAYLEDIALCMGSNSPLNLFRRRTDEICSTERNGLREGV